jgi:hypothetical protein
MTHGQKVAAGVVVGAFLLGLAGLGAVLGRAALHQRQVRQQTQVVASKPADTSSQTEDAATLKVGNGTGLSGLPLDTGGGSSSGGSAASGTSGGGTSKIPGPETFGEYEKHHDDKAALFADLRTGTGNEVAINKKVAIYYQGWLTNGTLFDESKAEKPGERPKPLAFTVGNHEVLLGMEQGVLGMKGGGKRRIVIPPAVGYGERGYGPVPSNAMMVFDVELVDVQ